MKTLFRWFLVSFGLTATTAAGAVEHVEPERFATLIQEADTLLVDVRTVAENKAARIKDSDVIDFYSKSFVEEIRKLPKDKTLLLYCRSGNRSGKTADLLAKMGYTRLVNLSGGIIAWKEAELPIEGD